MKYRQLGSSDLSVSEISLGSWLTYGVGVEADSARRCLDTAFDVGINFIDTAIYIFIPATTNEKCG